MREERTKERVTAGRQAALSLLFVEGIWQTKRAQWAGRLWVCCCGTKSAGRQADCILLFVDGGCSRQAGCCGTKRAQLQLQFELSADLN